MMKREKNLRRFLEIRVLWVWMVGWTWRQCFSCFSQLSQVVLFLMCFAFLFSPTKVEIHLGHPLPSLTCKKNDPLNCSWRTCEFVQSSPRHRCDRMATCVGLRSWSSIWRNLQNRQRKVSFFVFIQDNFNASEIQSPLSAFIHCHLLPRIDSWWSC